MWHDTSLVCYEQVPESSDNLTLDLLQDFITVSAPGRLYVLYAKDRQQQEMK